MLKPNGAAELTAFTEKSYKETITPIVPGIWHVLGVGHSNAVIIEGRTSVILVDTLDTLSGGRWRLRIGTESRLDHPWHATRISFGRNASVRTRNIASRQ
ncbi:MAG: hypothetical protein ACLR0N_03505 [Bilophila wadsworthia]